MAQKKAAAPAFDPNKAATGDSGIFGLPYTVEQAQLVFVNVPWEVTTSYGGGTSGGPAAILEASKQVDLYDLDVEKPYEPGWALAPERKEFSRLNREGKPLAQKVIQVGGELGKNKVLHGALKRVNALSEKVNQLVDQETTQWMDQGKIVGLIGGDHAIPLGAFRSVGRKHPGGYGILHFDAHSDTREAYEGFQYSHASIMNNALREVPELKKLVQVGIRDVCEQEVDLIRASRERVKTFFDRDLKRRQLGGTAWTLIAKEIVSTLPQEVWVSFDIDGLDPRYCPNTGTPVPGGQTFEEANEVLRALVASGRKIIGFDLNEVAPNAKNRDDEWDANVGARLLYKLGAWTLASRGLVKVRD